jgi:hypothetical protein
MPILIKSVTGGVLDNIITNVSGIKSMQSFFGHEEWFKIGYLEVFLQNFKKVGEIIELKNNKNIGLAINQNKKFKEIEISY